MIETEEERKKKLKELLGGTGGGGVATGRDELYSAQSEPAPSFMEKSENAWGSPSENMSQQNQGNQMDWNAWSSDLNSRVQGRPTDTLGSEQAARGFGVSASDVYGNTPEGAYQYMMDTGESPDFARQMAMHYYGIGGQPDMAKQKDNMEHQRWMSPLNEAKQETQMSPDMMRCQQAMAKLQVKGGNNISDLDAAKEVQDACGGISEVNQNPQMMQQLARMSSREGFHPHFWQDKMNRYSDQW